MSQPNGKSAATTFRQDEVAFMNELLAVLSRGGDPRVLVRAPVYASVAKKFIGMRARISAQPTEEAAEAEKGRER